MVDGYGDEGAEIVEELAVVEKELLLACGGGGFQGIPCDSSPARTIASTKSRAVNRAWPGPISRSKLPFRIKIFCLVAAGLRRIACPTPLKMILGMMEVYRLPML